MASIDKNVGAFQAPAGLRAKVVGAVNLERKLASTDLDTLNAAYVNVIRNHPVGGICVFGARTLSRTTQLRYVPVRRNLIYIKDNVRRLVSPYIFENNDATTWYSVELTIAQFLTNLFNQGGLLGATVNQAFYVICDDTVNTAATIAAGELHVTVGVSLESPAEFIVVNIGQWQGGSTAFEA
jgi:phage tail sheath protein FI